MPKPPLLPVIDWKSIFESGRTFEHWMAKAETLANREKMEDWMERLKIAAPVVGALKALPRRVNVVAIAEDWCGDVVRHVPALAKLSRSTDKLKISFITRGQHLDLFARFLTNGGEAIPKFIFLSENWVESGNWGPMPARHRELIARGKACGDVGAARKRVSALYEADPGQEEVIEELLALAVIAASEAM